MASGDNAVAIPIRRRKGRPDLAAFVDPQDSVLVSQYRWYLSKGKYASVKLRGEDGKWTHLQMHRFLCPYWAEVDHEDNDGLNNRRSNLRESSHSGNMANRGLDKQNTSGFKGVSFKKDKKRWRAVIKVLRKQIELGYFAVKEDAARAYDAAARRHFGEFARLNFPVDGEQGAR